MEKVIYLLLGVIIGSFISLWNVPFYRDLNIEEYKTLEVKGNTLYITKLPYMDCINKSSMIK